jgi:hypothetical protein
LKITLPSAPRRIQTSYDNVEDQQQKPRFDFPLDTSEIRNYVERLEPWTSNMQNEVYKLAKEVYMDATKASDREDK